MSSALPVLPVPRLVLWRHGRTEWNATGRFQGQLDPPLDEVGRNQAGLAAPQLLAGGLPPEETVVVSSDLSRAADTAATLIALLGGPLRLDARLREHGMGSWEGLTRDEVAERYPDQFADWMAGRPVRGRGGEDPAEVAERAVAALADLPPARAAVVVTHGGTAGRLMERLLEIDFDHRRVLGPLGNCAWSELVLQGDRWRLVRHNSSVPPSPGSSTEGVARRGAAPAPPSPPSGDEPPVTDADAMR
ncbi:histidine phosphatase family protein [Blastococcus sp. CT_GayMR16]|uniref:histidine phosphatase family protein n=1 Tax=Blastococcus sp. CT_GayMR16 TaxID=2559607 RepID=UPI0010732E48|nr:histidine phosphatase family protein [Blastococcus sp. CT_GayMR16]TFV91273.1 histidine phosphatase family protein [Blastococcus sp. CT_GayMR16]